METNDTQADWFCPTCMDTGYRCGKPSSLGDDECPECHGDYEQRGRVRFAALRTELERERLRLAVCGVIAMSNTEESVHKNREMNAEYWSASAADVAAAVDREMALRARVAELELRARYVSQEEAHELQDILRTLVPTGRAFITSARELVDKHESRGAKAKREALAEVAERLEKLADQWEEKADRSLEEAERIRATIKAETDAEDRCRTRTTLWLDCATEIRAALADEKETPHGE